MSDLKKELVVKILRESAELAHLKYGDLEFDEKGVLRVEMNLTADQWADWIVAIHKASVKSIFGLLVKP